MAKNLLDLAPDSIKAELAKLSPETLLYLKQKAASSGTRQKSADALKVNAVLDILTSHLDASELDYNELCEEPDSLTMATMLLTCQLLLGSSNLEEWEEDEQFIIIKGNLESVDSNKLLLSLFSKLSLTKQFKGSRKKRKDDEGEGALPSSDEDDEDEVPVIAAKKRNTLKKVPSK